MFFLIILKKNETQHMKSILISKPDWFYSILNAILYEGTIILFNFTQCYF